MKKRWTKVAFLLFVVIGILAGCTTQDQPAPEPEKPQVAETVTTTTYLPSKNAEYLVPVEVTIPKDTDTPQELLEEMIKKDAAEEYPAMPKGTKVLSVTVDPATKVATADFSRELKDNISGGSMSELLVVYMTVNTLTNLDGIDAVRITVEGNNINTLNGHMDLSEPLVRKEDAIRN